MKFAAGDVVKLKSGGPKMTIHSLPTATNEQYYCVWFKGASREFASFHEHTLEAA